jgi:N-acyl amino acid synthase of PEP-CTERM/exosortase system
MNRNMTATEETLPGPSLSQLFHRYFQVIPADSATLRKEVYRIRYEVYCREFKYERATDFPDGLEHDSFDVQRSHHCLLLHRETGLLAGCVRLVTNDPADLNAPLPFEQGGNVSLKNPDIAAMIEQRSQIGEISRLAVPATFRRRKSDPGSPIGELSIPDFSRNERRCFPHIPMGLYLAAAAIGLKMNLDGVFAMMELRLVRHLRRFGIVFEQAGDIIDYHGQRAVFYINRDGLFKHLQPEIRALLDTILADLETSQKTGTHR